MTSEYPDFVFVTYYGDMTEQTYDITVSCEAGTLVGEPVKYIRHGLHTRAVPDVPELVRYGLLRETKTDEHGEYRDKYVGKCVDGEYVRYDQAAAMLEAVRRQAIEDAARLVETSAYRSTTEGRSLVPCQFAKHDNHHATISAAIRALSAEPVQEEQS